MWGTRRAHCRSLPFARDDKKERVVERGGPLPKDRALGLGMTKVRVISARSLGGNV
jgi:hypothetical protein